MGRRGVCGGGKKGTKKQIQTHIQKVNIHKLLVLKEYTDQIETQEINRTTSININVGNSCQNVL